MVQIDQQKFSKLLYYNMNSFLSLRAKFFEEKNHSSDHWYDKMKNRKPFLFLLKSCKLAEFEHFVCST